eukprot:CAMPEP_0196705538 /NCGR_PEP_ID=MMETSP1090-20130531/60074_1 /TAXON_ID=37098 /ORGANISM="Isochrysis sp, Strain CCMP1244" /LENGTH=59 /DNA_ID=CAMNT_0042045447 /DNA_START=56 /DNA_END=231 /DNA_ORIENTATION=-
MSTSSSSDMPNGAAIATSCSSVALSVGAAGSMSTSCSSDCCNPPPSTISWAASASTSAS